MVMLRKIKDKTIIKGSIIFLMLILLSVNASAETVKIEEIYKEITGIH